MHHGTTFMDAPRTLRLGGLRLFLRAIRPSDEGRLRAMYEALSERSRYARFRGTPYFDDAHWRSACDVDGVDHVALVVVTEGGVIVGVGRFIRLSNPAHAEVAFTVADAYQRLGLGRTLTRALLPLARARGVTRLVAYTSWDNVGIARLLLGEGGELHRRDDGEVVITLDVDAASPRAARSTSPPPPVERRVATP